LPEAIGVCRLNNNCSEHAGGDAADSDGCPERTESELRWKGSLTVNDIAGHGGGRDGH
jgi:hypothetical protein